jgi:hypothetical protein
MNALEVKANLHNFRARAEGKPVDPQFRFEISQAHAAELLPVLEAFAEGKPIQCRNANPQARVRTWLNISPDYDVYFWNIYEFRITPPAPEPEPERFLSDTDRQQLEESRDRFLDEARKRELELHAYGSRNRIPHEAELHKRLQGVLNKTHQGYVMGIIRDTLFPNWSKDDQAVP